MTTLCGNTHCFRKCAAQFIEPLSLHVPDNPLPAGRLMKLHANETGTHERLAPERPASGSRHAPGTGRAAALAAATPAAAARERLGPRPRCRCWASRSRCRRMAAPTPAAAAARRAAWWPSRLWCSTAASTVSLQSTAHERDVERVHDRLSFTCKCAHGSTACPQTNCQSSCGTSFK